ncbi:uncharacterized protein LOC126787037 [Argentina anserina]|uniref:uncharacterized protein LOC126787037 n=1 Tax=Argentina anserina TaxID=57926 RepID=UPI0021768B0A|nr:uncharacterized protein LOC126787037 [Potentilla anserina]
MAPSCSLATIDSSNIGFKLLQKHGWKEGTGLGISEQGRLEPVETYLKNDKLGLGAEKLQVKKPHSNNKEARLAKKKKKMQELEKRLQEKEFERAFCREFWPDNV